MLQSRKTRRVPVRAKDGSGFFSSQPVPSASVAAETLQESKHQRRVEPSHLPKDAHQHRHYLAGRCRLRSAGYLRWPHSHAETFKACQPRHQLQHLSHDVDLLAYTRGVADRTKSDWLAACRAAFLVTGGPMERRLFFSAREQPWQTKRARLPDRRGRDPIGTGASRY